MKKITASILALTIMGSAMSVTASAANKKDLINPPKDSATFLSLTYCNLFDTLNSTEYYVSIKNVETGETKTVARRDNDTFLSTVNKKGELETKFVVDNTLYTVDDDEETITVDVLNVPTQDVSVIDYANLKFETSFEEDGCTVEQFASGSNTEYYYFDNSGDLVTVKTIDKKGNESVYTVLAFDDEVPSDLFTTKKGYEIKSAKYSLEDTRTMKLFDELLNSNEYTLAFDSNEYSAILVKSGYDYYANYSDLIEKTTTKKLALGSKIYTFDDTKKTYTEAERMYNDQIPTFFDTRKYELDSIEKVNEGKKTYLVETLSDNTGIYKYYWDGTTLVKIEKVNSSDKVLSTTTFKSYSATADTAALTLPTNYKLEEAKTDIGVGEGEAEGTESIETTTTSAPEETTSAETTETTNSQVTVTVAPTTSVKTGNSTLLPAAVIAAISAVAVAFGLCKKKK